MNDRERFGEINRQVKRSDEYAEKGNWEASDAWIVHLHNEGHINYLIERTQELESERADWELGHKQLQERVEELEGILEQDARQEVIEGLCEQNKRYREALEFYANQYNWMVIEVPTMMDGEPEMVTREPSILDDGGRKASLALRDDTQ